MSREQVERLLAAIYPTRIERLLSRFVTWAYQHQEGGVIDWFGDRADDLKVWNLRRRAHRKASQNGS